MHPGACHFALHPFFGEIASCSAFSRRALNMTAGSAARFFRSGWTARSPERVWSACRSGDQGSPDRTGEGLLKEGGIVSAPSSVRNGSNARGLKMHRTRKGNQQYFGMKLRTGTDPQGLVRHLEGTAPSIAPALAITSEHRNTALNANTRTIHRGAPVTCAYCPVARRNM